jgi:TRAP-type C4-dicarboxylate transport system permease small subunit
MEPDLDDKFLNEMLHKSTGPIPFSDFEDELMLHIKASEKQRKTVRTELRFSWLFFGLGMIAGMLMVAFLPEWRNFTGSIDIIMIARSLPVIGFILVFLLFARNLLNLTRRYKR